MNEKPFAVTMVLISGIIGLIMGYCWGVEDTNEKAIDAKVMQYNPQTGKPEFIKCKESE